MIEVKKLSKVFKTRKKPNGKFSTLKDLVSRQYKDVIAVDKISFEIGEGELVGLLGPNGAGKTTTLKMLSGILYPTSGSIEIAGFTPYEKEHKFLKSIAFLMGQRNTLLWELPAEDSFKLNKEIYEIDEHDYKKTLDELTTLLDCSKLITRPVKTLSLGERMKMELIASLLHRPKVLFLDEPTIGLDVVAQKTIRDFIKDYQRLTQATIILTSHYMEDVRALAGRVIIIDHGGMIYDGALDKLVTKYATRKTIEVIVEELPTIETLKKLSIQPEVDFPRLLFQVKRNEIGSAVTQITKHLIFSDINIYEEKIEDIVRKIFEKKFK